jgi:hypothetical protein
MNRLYVLLFFFFPRIGFAQDWTVEQIGALPEPVSNNAVCEAIVNDTLYLYSFAGIDSTLHSSGIHLRAYRINKHNNGGRYCSARPSGYAW